MGCKRKNSEVSKEEQEKVMDLWNKIRRITRNSPLRCEDCQGTIKIEEEKLQNETTTNIEGLICNLCEKAYHYKCGGVPDDEKLNQMKRLGVIERWLCPSCMYSTLLDHHNFKQKIDEETKSVADELKKVSTFLSTQQTIIKGLEEGQKQIMIDTKTKFEEVDCTIKTIRLENDELKKELNELKKTLERATDRPESGPTYPNTSNPQLLNEINYISSMNRKHNLIIQNVPEVMNEDEGKLTDIIKRIGGACGMDVKDSDIVSAHRIEKKNPTKPSLILVKFNGNSNAKDQLLTKYFTSILNNIPPKLSMIGMASDTRIFINHHLSKELLQIKDKALVLKQARVIQKVNARYNTIRIVINNQPHKIFNLAQLRDIVHKGTGQDMDAVLAQQQRKRS